MQIFSWGLVRRSYETIKARITLAQTTQEMLVLSKWKAFKKREAQNRRQGEVQDKPGRQAKWARGDDISSDIESITDTMAN